MLRVIIFVFFIGVLFITIVDYETIFGHSESKLKEPYDYTVNIFDKDRNLIETVRKNITSRWVGVATDVPIWLLSLQYISDCNKTTGFVGVVNLSCDWLQEIEPIETVGPMLIYDIK